MLPVNCGSHADYQNFVVTNLRKYYPDPSALARSTWDIIERFWNLDLSFTDTFMADKYSKFGPAPRTPSSMQRSYLLSIDFKVTSITEWAAQLKINPLYAILSGFEPGNTPGVGTFYDFINRLWNSDDDHMSPQSWLDNGRDERRQRFHGEVWRRLRIEMGIGHRPRIG